MAGSSWLIVAAGFHFRGGMDRANAALASYLLAGGARVHLAAHEVDPLFVRQPAATIHIVPRPLNSFALGEFGLDRRGRQVARDLLAREPNARVVVNGGNCRWPDVNWVHYVHHAWTKTPGEAPLWFQAKHRAFSARWRRSEKVALRTARIVIANSELTRSHLLSHLGLRPDRVRTVYLGADADCGSASREERAAARRWLGIPSDRTVVAFVGGLGLDRRKGFDTLWAAWTALCAGPGWDAHLVVAGGGADANGLRAAALQAGLADRVHILGHSDRVRDVLAGADLLVSPVRYEPYGLNVQEAVCRGVPVIVSRGAGVAERFPPELAGMLLDDPDDARELAERLRFWRGRVAEWKNAVAPLSARLRSYSWSDMAAEFVAAVNGSPARQPGELTGSGAR